MFNCKGISALLFSVLSANGAYSAGLDDPTLPLEMRGRVVADVSLQLNSILIADDRRVAIINGHVISQGENVSGIRVLSITEDSVKVIHRGKQYRLTMGTAASGVRK